MNPTEMNGIEVSAIKKNRCRSRLQVKSVAGFTLVEVLMALSISALVAVLAYGSVSAATSAVTTTRLQAERLDRLDTTWQLLARDLQQIVAPPIEQRSVPHLAPVQTQSLGLFGAITSGSAEGAGDKAVTLLRFVRSGWKNPLKRHRSDLQLVIYEWYKSNLYRRHEPFYEGMTMTDIAIDPTGINTLYARQDNSEGYSRRRLLLGGVDSITLRFLPASARHLGDDQWQTAWPPAADSSALPVALKVTFAQRQAFKIERVFDIPAGFVR